MDEAHRDPRQPPPRAADTLRVLQITDTHLYAESEARLQGVVTETALADVLALARARCGPVDLVAATGDLVHDGSEAGYARLRAHLATLGAPVHAVPGNHDDHGRLEALAGDGPPSFACCGEARIGPWLLVFLDSAVNGEDWGHLRAEELARLDAALAGHTGPAGVFLHHPALAVGSAWIDAIRLREPGPFLELLRAHRRRVRFVACGHVHQRFEAVRDGILHLTTPATCIQFLPRSERFAVDRSAASGLRWLDLLPDGRLRTGVLRLPRAAPAAVAPAAG